MRACFQTKDIIPESKSEGGILWRNKSIRFGIGGFDWPIIKYNMLADFYTSQKILRVRFVGEWSLDEIHVIVEIFKSTHPVSMIQMDHNKLGPLPEDLMAIIIAYLMNESPEIYFHCNEINAFKQMYCRNQVVNMYSNFVSRIQGWNLYYGKREIQLYSKEFRFSKNGNTSTITDLRNGLVFNSLGFAYKRGVLHVRPEPHERLLLPIYIIEMFDPTGEFGLQKIFAPMIGDFNEQAYQEYCQRV